MFRWALPLLLLHHCQEFRPAVSDLSEDAAVLPGARDAGTSVDANEVLDGTVGTDSSVRPCASTHLVCEDFEDSLPATAVKSAAAMEISQTHAFSGRSSLHMIKSIGPRGLAYLNIAQLPLASIRCSFQLLTTARFTKPHYFLVASLPGAGPLAYEVGVRYPGIGGLGGYERKALNYRSLLGSAAIPVNAWQEVEITIDFGRGTYALSVDITGNHEMGMGTIAPPASAATMDLQFGMVDEDAFSESWDVYMDNVICDTI
jgi:hypothetical protein